MTNDQHASRTIVITGAGSGIGRACAVRLAGARVHIVAMGRNGATAAETVGKMESIANSAIAVECDDAGA